MGRFQKDAVEHAADSVPRLPDEAAPFQPWEEIDTGRYMPRRIRGSFRGGELGWTFVIPSRADGSKTQ